MDEPANMSALSINDVARKLRMSVHSIRMYEREGLILPATQHNRHRLYNREDVERIRALKKVLDERLMTVHEMKLLFSLNACWEIKSCSQNLRRNCPAYKDFGNPCWVMKAKQSGLSSTIECRNCPIYSSVKSYNDLKGLYSKLVTCEVAGVA